MLLVDSSVWIDYFNGRPSPEAERLDGLLGREEILTGDLILAEVLRGFDRDADYRRARDLMRVLSYRDMLGEEVAFRAIDYSRALRRRGITVRKTIDALIASFCIINGHSLLHRDRDFEPFRRYFGLVIA